MFHFFSTKHFLVDSLSGIVDIHNHVLPGIDDGAKNIEESKALLQQFNNLGITELVATPHIMLDVYPNTSSTINTAYCLLKNGLSNGPLDHMVITSAAEHLIAANFHEMLQQKQVMTIKEQYLLVEMSYLQPSINFEEAIQQTKEFGLYPILAHPERYGYLHQHLPTLKKYKDQGVLFQLNTLSLTSYYGSAVQKMALKLLALGWYDFIASDAHNTNQLEVIKNIKLPKKIMTQLQGVIDKTKGSF